MTKAIVLWGLSAVLAGAAEAADKPVIAPPPAWVHPVAIPPAPATPDGAPIRVLLSDQQVQFERGRVSTYTDVALLIETPQGLQAGNLSFPWRPDTDVLTVHRLLIHRGAQRIDVLAAGQSFTVLRREQNLENATLDGVLTATIQPEGLQVGDVLEVAGTVASSDPVLKGHVELIGGAWNGFAVERAHMGVHWPAALPVRVRETAALPAATPATAGGTTSFELSADHLQPVVPPKGAPPRYALGRLAEFTDYASWADLGALMAPLYDKAATLPASGPLHDELARIAAASPDPAARTEAALALVQDRVRYVALAMGAGGYTPADAAETWSRRYGDCKGKTALLLALLRGLGIDAQPVVVSTALGDGLDERLPMVGLFNHVLVRATVAGHPYWLDGTRTGDTRLDRLRVPAFGWGLPLVPTGAALVRMQPAPLTVPGEETSIRIDASAGISAPAPATIETVIRGDEAVTTNLTINALTGDARDRALKDYWTNQYDFIEVKTATTAFDPKAGELRLAMTGTATLDWSNGNYQTDGTAVGYRADFARDPGPGHDAPFAVPFPYYTKVREVILLPKGGGDFKLGTGMEIDQTAGGIEYRRHATIAAGVFTIEKTERSVVPEFPAKDAAAEQAALRTLSDKTAQLRMPAAYSYSGKDIEAARRSTPTTARDFINRGMLYAYKQMTAEAIADYTKAIELDPNNVYAFANRSMARIATNDLPGARADLAKADAIDPSAGIVAAARGALAEHDGQSREAIADYSRGLDQAPEDLFLLARRAGVRATINDNDGVIADTTAALKIDPNQPQLLYLRAIASLNERDQAHAMADRQAILAMEPKTAANYHAAGLLASIAGHRADALADFDRAIAIAPTAGLYAERSDARGPDDEAGRRADMAAALRLEPNSPSVLWALANSQEREGDRKGEIATLGRLIAIGPVQADLYFKRAQAYRTLGDTAHALDDSATGLKLKPNRYDIYLMRANLFRTAGRQEDALKEAAASEAAAVQPGAGDAAYGHVVAANIYSAFGRNADAVKAYDRALAVKPDAYIYLNRGLRRPKTDTAGRLADYESALSLDPTMSEAIAAKAELQRESGDTAGAVATYSAALARKPDDPDMLLGRGVAYAQSGDAAHAEQDFAAARAKAPADGRRGFFLNEACWSKATANVALQSALDDCDAALKSLPGAAMVLDSRAFVLLRLGRVEEAIQVYGEALAKSPTMASSLFGRAAAWSRKGERTRAQADLAAAVKADPDVRTRFEGYGVKL